MRKGGPFVVSFRRKFDAILPPADQLETGPDHDMLSRETFLAVLVFAEVKVMASRL